MTRISIIAGVLVCMGLTASGDVFNMGPGLTNLETVRVGNPENVPDTREMSDKTSGFGSVDYEFNIGKYAVTAAQYTVFLNAVAATDTYELYNTRMWTYTYGCKIQRHGEPGSYTYSVASDYANRPVNVVSWASAARFANWLHNGQPVGSQNMTTTEDGAYTLKGALGHISLTQIQRNTDWKWAIPTEDEWHKAAYHKNDGVAGNYWLYPTSSDSINISMANYDWSVGQTTDVGSYYGNASPYGTYDQGGNVWEWNEAILHGGPSRGLRGGSFDVHSGALQTTRYFSWPTSAGANVNIGFRVVWIFVMGDFNGDGVLSGLDIPGFKYALSVDPQQYFNETGVDPRVIGDFNGDGYFSGLDIPGFKTALAGGEGAAAVPEPGTLALAGLASVGVLSRRRRARRLAAC